MEVDMGQILSLVQKDPRIFAVCEIYFPNSPEFARYLADRVVALGAPYEFARVLCTTLRAQHSLPPPTVSAETVERLSVDTIPSLIIFILSSCSYGQYKAVERAMVFLMRVSGIIEVPRGAASVDDLIVRPRASIDQTKTLAYARLFYCASAMLDGVKIDPRRWLHNS